VTEGTYTGAGAEVVVLDEDARLSGGWDEAFTTQSGSSIVDGEGSRRGITVGFAVSAIIERFTAQNGYDYYGVGGIHNDGTLTLNSSTVRDNTSRIGGGVGNVGFLTLNNCTVSGNRSVYDGGGINNGGALTVNNSTVSDNTARDGGGIRNYLGFVTLQNTIVAGNTASASSPDCVGTISSAGYNLIGDTSGCTFLPTTGDLLDVDAWLFPLVGSPGYHPLLPDSPAIDAGNPAGCTDHRGNPLDTDQRGFPRFGRCDIGAYEMQPIGFSTKSANETSIGAGHLLTYTIALTNGGAAGISGVHVTDTLPISVTYVYNSLTATTGSYGYATGVVTWTGSVNAGTGVTITFGATVTETAPLGVSIANSAIISGGGEIITRTATFQVGHRIYLPIVMKGGG
jgi:uncharacterized repeat protein (TIGR01451 family)